MSVSSIHVFDGGVIPDSESSGGSSGSANIKNLIMRDFDLNLGGETVSSKILCDYNSPQESSPYYAPVNIENMAQWTKDGFNMQVRLESQPSIAANFGFLARVSIAQGSTEDEVTNAKVLTYERLDDHRIKFNILNFDKVTDEVTSITYLKLSGMDEFTLDGDIYITVEDIIAKIPSSASSTNKLVTDQQLDNVTASLESGYTPKGPASVSTLNGLTGQENGDQYIVTDSGTLTDGSLAVTAGESVAWDSVNEEWYKVNQYALSRFGTNEVKNLAQTASESDLTSGNYIPVDTPTGPKKLTGDAMAPKSVQENVVRSLAPAFDSTRTSENPYKSGEIVTNNGKVYTFKNPHYGPWDANDVLFIAFSRKLNCTDFVAVKGVPYCDFVREVYIPSYSNTKTYVIDNVSRGKNGNWYISINNNEYHVTLHEESNYVKFADNSEIEMVVDWSIIPEGTQVNTLRLTLSSLCSAVENCPSILAEHKYILSKAYTDDELLKFDLIYDSSADARSGYTRSNNTDGTPYPYNVGDTIELRHVVSSPCYAKIKVCAGEIVLVPYVLYSSYTYAYPILTDISNAYITTYDTRSLADVVIDGVHYRQVTITSDGYLLVSYINNVFKVYSKKPTSRQSFPHELSESQKLSFARFYGYSVLPDIFDYEVAVSMDKGLLRAIIESASRGKCTVLYDTNGYPSLMRKLPIMSIGSLDSRLGDDNTPHPAFNVGGATKNVIYAGVFLNSLYNGVPVSWFGDLPLMRSYSSSQSKTMCAEKGTGWHMETIWERSLISLLTMRIQNTPKPLGNNDRGRSLAKKFLCALRNEAGNAMPGSWQNGDRWVNGSQPVEWTHDGTEWGIYDIIGGYHEFVDLAKSVDGKIYLADDNDYTSDETTWTDTGAHITYDGSHILFSNEKKTEVTGSSVSDDWVNIYCDVGYDTLSEATRKRLATALICPRLSSADSSSLFDFDGIVQILDGISAYPFMGGAEEYSTSGLGRNYWKYPNTEAHNNMGSRLFYIE